MKTSKDYLKPWSGRLIQSSFSNYKCLGQWGWCNTS